VPGKYCKTGRKKRFLSATPLLVLLFWPASQALAQSSAVDELKKTIIELYGAGKFAEAVPLAQQALAIYEKTLGPHHPNVAAALNNLAGSTTTRGATPRPSRSTSGGWRSGKRRSGPIILMARRR
jgi:Tetratricopeptide repeat